MVDGTTMRERLPDDTGPTGRRRVLANVRLPDLVNTNGEPKLAVRFDHLLRAIRGCSYSAPPCTPGRIGGSVGNSSSSAIANTFGSDSAMGGSCSKPSGMARSTSTS